MPLIRSMNIETRPSPTATAPGLSAGLPLLLATGAGLGARAWPGTPVR